MICFVASAYHQSKTIILIVIIFLGRGHFITGFMTLHHLEIFVAVCREKTTHAAAEVLNISQPAVSKAISDLEKYYQIKVFERINHRLYLTSVGKLLLTYAQNLLDLNEEMEHEIRLKENMNHIRIGASVSVGTYLVPQYIQKLKDQVEGLTYEVVVNNTSDIENKVDNYQLDLGIVEGHVDNKNFIVKNIEEDELVLVVKATHPLLIKKEIEYSDLENYPFIIREQGSSNRNQLELFLKEKGIQLMMNYTCSSIEAIKQALLYTDGIASLSKMMVDEEIKKGVYKILPFKDMKFQRSIRLIYHKNKYVTKTMETFFDLLDHKV